MAEDDDTNQPAAEEEQGGGGDGSESEGENAPPLEFSWALSSSSESESEYDSDDSDPDAGGGGGRSYYDDDSSDEVAVDENTPETNLEKFKEVLESRPVRKRAEEDDRNYVYHEDLFDFPRDPENWREEDIQELWADAPLEMTKPGWDPVWADEEDWEVVKGEVRAGRDPPIAPFYLPYRKNYPAIPDNHHDIANPKSVIEELDRVEEFLKWVSYIFADGSSYEGTVWDDLAHGKGVYVAEQGLAKYEGEWLQNAMEGHGVVEVDIPGVEPVPGSKLEAKMRAEGRIIKRDFMSPEDKKWLEMDIEDSIRLAGHVKVTPFYENDEWINVFGEKPEKGRYRYAGQWKHGRMHGCGVYEVNERIIYGRFYFGEHVEDSTGCDSDVSALHAGIAEVAAAKSRMFVNKPDGMVREERGPYGDPQHPYFYDEDDVWMAPGFVNQFYEIPDYWKTYVEEIDQEREMWLNSFYKSPLRIPMPAELEYWWSKDDEPEFVLINKEPEPDPEDPSKLIYTEDPLIVHTPTGQLINYVDDEKYGVRLFWQPHLEEGEDVDPEKAQFLPLGFDEFFGRVTPGANKGGRLMRLITTVENALKPLFDKLERWAEEKKKASEMNLKLIEKELEFIEAELCLDEAIEDMEIELKRKQKEEEKRTAEEKGEDGISAEAGQDDADSEDGFDEGEDEGAPASFGTVGQPGTDKGAKNEGGKFGKSPFSSLSISVASCSPTILVPSKLQEAFLSWKASRQPVTAAHSSPLNRKKRVDHGGGLDTVKFPCSLSWRTNLRVVRDQHGLYKTNTSHSQLNSSAHRLYKTNTSHSQLNSLARILSSRGACGSSGTNLSKGRPEGVSHNLSILSLHFPVNDDFTICL